MKRNGLNKKKYAEYGNTEYLGNSMLRIFFNKRKIHDKTNEYQRFLSASIDRSKNQVSSKRTCPLTKDDQFVTETIFFLVPLYVKRRWFPVPDCLDQIHNYSNIFSFESPKSKILRELWLHLSEWTIVKLH